jgi:hypothetical protein
MGSQRVVSLFRRLKHYLAELKTNKPIPAAPATTTKRATATETVAVNENVEAFTYRWSTISLSDFVRRR